MILTTSESAEATEVLAAAGILGSDAASCLRILEVMAPDVDFRMWRDGIVGMAPESLMVRYGTDAGRAAVALAR